MTAIVFALWRYTEARFYRGMIPAKIETSGVYYIDSKFDLLGGCGIAAFTLSEQTIRDINRDGLKFFESARSGTGIRIYGDDQISSYAPWKETPVPFKSLSDGLGSAFSKPCSGEPQKGWNEKVLSELEKEGNYYSHNENYSSLLVLPALKTVIFAYYN